VRVAYTVCFTTCEATAGSTFVETAVLRGDDFIFDNNLLTLRSNCVKAVPGCVNRVIETIVSNSTLDEDGDTIIFGWVIGDEDEIYAKVWLTPFTPVGTEAQSNVVRGHFGPAGA
jgi:hypothetical protein